MKGYHEEFVVLPDGAHAFISGVEDKCNHNFQDTVYMLDNGEYIHKKNVLCPADEATDPYVRTIAERKNTWVCGQTSACCRCGKIYSMSDILREGL